MPLDLGPQNPKDSAFIAKMRLHQSWYRARILQIPYGTGPKPKNRTYFGNMLTLADGERGMNFLTPHIFQVAMRRLSGKKGATDRFRLLFNMLSSQAMCFNLLAPLVDNLDLATQLMQNLLPGEVSRVHKIIILYSPEPPSEYLNDLSTFDALVEYIRGDGHLAFIGIEAPLANDFPSRTIIQPAYWKWAQLTGSPWLDTPRSRFLENDVNPIWRMHLLAESLRRHPTSKYTAGHLLYIYHPLDELLAVSVKAYQTLLKAGEETFSSIRLDQLLERWQHVIKRETDQEWLDRFILRYLDLQASEKDLAVKNL